jgi:DNA-binding NarL/FixJ family response regulator
MSNTINALDQLDRRADVDGIEEIGDTGHGTVDVVSRTIRVFVLDDHESVRAGLRLLIDSEPDLEVVGESDRGELAVGRCLLTEPDVALLDVNLPDRSGIEVCRELRERAPSVRSIMISSYGEDEALFQAVIAGASGYVMKHIRGSDLVSCIRRVASGESLLDRAASERLRDRALADSPDPEIAVLTGQERRVLELLTEGLTNRQIADRLYLSDKTVKNYVSNVLMKLGLTRRSEAAALAARLSTRRSVWRASPAEFPAIRF